MPKLTLNADLQVIEEAKRIAEERGVSVSAMFSEFIRAMSSRRPSRRTPAPITRRLRGLARVSPEKSDRQLFEEAILEKTRR